VETSTICDKDATQLDRQDKLTERTIVAVTLVTHIPGVLSAVRIYGINKYDDDEYHPGSPDLGQGFCGFVAGSSPHFIDFFSIYLILPAIPWPKGLFSLYQKRVPDPSGGKALPARKTDHLTAISESTV
jgi:hypothetical protein